MDNYKIGRLIAKLRKEKNLTQQQLGDMVGVGDRAVSKWERGLTVPDITIINNLSKILGISSDELLSGEIKEEIIEEKNDQEQLGKKKKSIIKYVKLILFPTILLIAIISIMLIYNNKTYVYDIVSTEPNLYTIDGKVIFENNKLLISINNIKFEDKEFSKTIIQNYEYDIKSGNKFIFRFGYLNEISNIDKPKTINEFFKQLSINHTSITKLKRDDITNKTIIITFRFLDGQQQEIIKVINTKLINPTE